MEVEKIFHNLGRWHYGLRNHAHSCFSEKHESKEEYFSKNSCVFTICLYVSRHKALSPDQRPMNFTIFVEGFIEIIILHLVFLTCV